MGGKAATEQTLGRVSSDIYMLLYVFSLFILAAILVLAQSIVFWGHELFSSNIFSIFWTDTVCISLRIDALFLYRKLFPG